MEERHVPFLVVNQRHVDAFTCSSENTYTTTLHSAPKKVDTAVLAAQIWYGLLTSTIVPADVVLVRSKSRHYATTACKQER